MYGVGVPETRRLARRAAGTHADLWAEAATWEAALRRLWDGAAHREERYAALAIIRSKPSASHAGRMESLALYEHKVGRNSDFFILYILKFKALGKFTTRAQLTVTIF